MADYVSLPNAAELVGELRCFSENRFDCDYKCLISTIDKAAYFIESLLAENAKLKAEKNDILTVLTNDMVPRRMFDNVCAQRDELKAERDAAVSDLQDCMHYAKPKNNNVCNFCKNDMAEYHDKCAGWSDFCECEPEWRGVQKEEEDD